MKIRNKLLLSNIMLIVCPILLSAIFGIILFFNVGVQYLEPLTQMYSGDGGVYSAQSLLYAYSKEVSVYQWELFTDAENANEDLDFLKTTGTMQNLEKELLEIGFTFCILDNGNIIYSNIENEDLQDLLIEYTLDTNNSISTNENGAFLKQTIPNSDIVVCAISSGESIDNQGTYLQRYIVNFFMLFIVFSALIVIIISIIISKINTKMMLKPLNKLKLATEAIAQGNLDTDINYYKTDEFGEVFNSFDKMREHLKLSIEENLKLEEYRKNLIADISHDLRTPLTTIKGYTEGLIDNVPKTPEKREQYYFAIQTRTSDMEKLINNLSTLSNLETGKKKYDLKIVKIIDYINHFVEKRKDDYENNLIFLTKQNEIDVKVKIDTGEFERVFLNIIENSGKYRKFKDVKVHISTKQINDFIEISISDNGKGVAKKSVDKLFYRFYREDKARASQNEGHGLGLSIVNQIVEDHSGSILAENKNGLTIKIKLPIHKED